MPRMSTMIESTKLLLKDWEKTVNVADKNPSLLNIQKAIKAEEIFILEALTVSEKDEETLCLQFLTSINETTAALMDKLDPSKHKLVRAVRPLIFGGQYVVPGEASLPSSFV